jgi:hypothetical protein
MAAEEYETETTHAFSSLEMALHFLIKKSPISIGHISELRPFKRQKLFNPEAEEIVRIV